MRCIRERCSFPMAPHDVLCVRHRSMLNNEDPGKRANTTTSRAQAHVSGSEADYLKLRELERVVDNQCEALIAKTRECERTASRLAEETLHNRRLLREVEGLRAELVAAGKREQDLLRNRFDNGVRMVQPREVIYARETDNHPLSAWATVGCAMVGFGGAEALLYLGRMLFA